MFFPRPLNACRYLTFIQISYTLCVTLVYSDYYSEVTGEREIDNRQIYAIGSG